MVRRLLVANRGEIALRIVRAAFDEGIETVVVTSQADRDALPAMLADRAVCIGPADPRASYLSVEAVIGAAVTLDCDAVHPGYGFLSEQPELAQACEQQGIAFVGPSVETLRRGGDKTASRELAASLGIPVPRAVEPPSDIDELRRQVAALGYPVLVKAAAGGGGRGMALLRADPGLAAAVDSCTREASQAFGDGRVFIEHFVERGRHIEVQIFGDGHGGVVHLGERDCSIQRRYQKVIEEAPAVGLGEDLREALYAAALELGRALRYRGAGTVEFLVDEDDDSFFFLELNARIQVEHPVTEAVTGLDLVRMQLALVEDGSLPVQQDAVRMRGHAIECRVTCEDPLNDFAPSPGTVERWVTPQGTCVRLDTHVVPGYVVPPFYDSLLGKLICTGQDRADALDTSRRALSRFVADGVQTNLPVLVDVIEDPDFVGGGVSTRWFEDKFMPAWRRGRQPSPSKEPPASG